VSVPLAPSHEVAVALESWDVRVQKKAEEQDRAKFTPKVSITAEFELFVELDEELLLAQSARQKRTEKDSRARRVIRNMVLGLSDEFLEGGNEVMWILQIA